MMVRAELRVVGVLLPKKIRVGGDLNHSSAVTNFLLSEIWDPKDGGNRFFRNVGNV
jgi:hypothetical protein